jgi:MFS family permease
MSAVLRRTQRNLLIAARTVRSIGQGVLVVDFVLYLRALHWSATTIGGVLTAALLFGVVLTAIVGPLSDHLGRKPMLIVFEFTQVLATLAALASSNSWIIIAAAITGQFGRGGNGAAGPFAPVEQAWLARFTPPAQRGEVYSRNAGLAFAGLAAGALIAGIAPTVSAWPVGRLPGSIGTADDFRLIFLLPLLCSLACLACISLVRDVPEPAGGAAPASAKHIVRRQENALLLRLMFANLLQGIGIGLAGPMVAYWFAVRFGQGPKQIGPLMAAGFLLAAFSSFGAGQLTRRFGIVPVVVAMRLVGLLLLLAMPLLPNFALAASAYVTRSFFNRGTNGPRQALSMSLVGADRRGLAGSLNTISLQLPRSVGPLLVGLLFDTGMLAFPFLLAAGFQAAYLWYYASSFGSYERQSVQKRTATADA